MINSEIDGSQIDLDQGLRTLLDLITALSSAVGALKTVQLSDSGEGTDFYEAVRRCEIMLIEQALKKTRGNQAQAARMLKLKQTTLHGKIKKYRISPTVLFYGEGGQMMESHNSTNVGKTIENIS